MCCRSKWPGPIALSQSPLRNTAAPMETSCDGRSDRPREGFEAIAASP